MHSEHHIDGFDLESFFKLHDLDNNGVLDVSEIEAIYGLNHHSVSKKVHDKDSRAKEIVDEVLKALDANNDGESASNDQLCAHTCRGDHFERIPGWW